MRTLAVVLLALALATDADAARSNLRAAQEFVAHRCHAGSTRATNLWQVGWTFNALYGDCGGGDGHDQHAWFFSGARFVGVDAPGSSAEIIGLWRDGNTIAFLYVLYRRNDALCCPTGGGKVVRFRWTGKRVIALDRLPPRETTTSTRVARYP